MPPCAVARIAGRRILSIGGPDRAQWLHGVCTNDILHLATGRRGDSFRKGERARVDKTPAGPGCYAVAANRQGKMIAEFKARLFEQRIQLDTGEPGLLDALSRTIVMDEVDLVDRTAEFAVFTLVGPQARECLKQVYGTIPFLKPFHHVVIGGALISPVMFGIDLQVAAGDAAATQAKLTAAGATALGEAALDALRIEEGWPRWGADLDATVLPMEAGLEPIAISYTKGCYTGQEVIQRVKTYSEAPRALVSLSIESDAEPAPGLALTADGAEVGRVTSAAISPSTGRAVALAYVRKDFKEPGRRVLAGGAIALVSALKWRERLA
jgi:folate-binding protein YgfZ